MKHSIESINNLKHRDTYLKAIEIIGEKSTRKVICECKCGVIKAYYINKVISGYTKSCGCFNILKIKQTHTKFHPVIKQLYTCYMAMIDRCYNLKNNRYFNYGGAGVIVCNEWKENYQVFLDWSLANGWQKGLQLDKDIKGNGKLYSPETCCFVTAKTNANNRSTCRYFDYNGKRLTLMQICQLENVKYESVRHRIRHTGDNINQAVIFALSR